jgi:hypothetical protein
VSSSRRKTSCTAADLVVGRFLEVQHRGAVHLLHHGGSAALQRHRLEIDVDFRHRVGEHPRGRLAFTRLQGRQSGQIVGAHDLDSRNINHRVFARSRGVDAGLAASFAALSGLAALCGGRGLGFAVADRASR